MSGRRTMLLVAHTGRPAALRSARPGRGPARARPGSTCGSWSPRPPTLGCAGADVVPAVARRGGRDAEMVMVLGGDGTLLRAAEMARPAGVPLLGVNLGHVGFLAEAEPDDLPDAVDRVISAQVLGGGADDD